MAQSEAERIQAEYLDRLRRMLRRAPADIREDAVREVGSHIEDEWQSLGADLPALHTVLQRLGPPEEYGRDLALQLMLQRGVIRRSPLQLAAAVFFWVSTSLIGMVIVLSAAFVFAFALGMVVIAVERLRGSDVLLIDATGFQFLSYRADRLLFPPESWSPAVCALVGLLPALIIFAGLYRFLTLWVRSRLAAHGLELVTRQAPPASPPGFPSGWERRAVLAMLGFAGAGLAGCLLFTILSELVPVGRPGNVSLPEDFFRTPLTFLVFISSLVFLSAPVLGLLWAARRRR